MNRVQMAAKLYECRDAAQSLFGDGYMNKIQPYKEMIQVVMKANNIGEIPALLKISQTETYQENAVGQMMFMAAVVELIEPSNTTESKR
jgi:hypothetical protein